MQKKSFEKWTLDKKGCSEKQKREPTRKKIMKKCECQNPKRCARELDTEKSLLFFVHIINATFAFINYDFDFNFSRSEMHSKVLYS